MFLLGFIDSKIRYLGLISLSHETTFLSNADCRCFPGVLGQDGCKDIVRLREENSFQHFWASTRFGFQ